MNTSAIREETKQRLRKAAPCILLVGIPCYNSESTITYIIETIGKGLKKYFNDYKSLILIADGGSLDDTREKANLAKIPNGIKKIVSIYRGIPGKGTALRAVFEAAKILQSKALCVFDSDLRSITPEWIRLFFSPILKDEYDFCAPAYTRAKYDGTITNHLVYPLTRTLYGLKIRQPIGGDFGVSGKLSKFYTSQNVWGEFVAKFGIDVWMTTSAIAEGFKICQVNPGVKIHDPKDPAASLGPMFMQVIYTLFSLMGKYKENWRVIQGSKKVKTYDPRALVPPEPVDVSFESLKLELRDGFSHFGTLWKEIISEEAFKELGSVLKGRTENLSPELWAKIVYDFAFIFNLWERNRHKLVDILTPLYFGRIASFILETKDMTNSEAEAVIEHQAVVFENLKSYLVKRWFK
ncbi:glycosyltransferase [candidate division WOR-3 bacterium]|nr:glycosyltransferase [candidate division WOR-3 bacterium]